MKTQLNVLLVEDSQDDELLLMRELRSNGYEPLMIRVETRESMMSSLEKQAWDIVISDYTMPEFSGIEALEVLGASGLDIPFILVSGSIGEDLAAEAMRHGARDFVTKENLKRLAPAIEREMREAESRRLRNEMEERMRVVERLRNVGEVAATILHDLKNPMQVILSYSEFIEFGEQETSESADYARTIQREVRRMLAMLQEILDFSRGEIKLNLGPVDLNALCLELLEIYQYHFAESGVQLTAGVKFENTEVAPVQLDREKIWRALLNLISNARDAMPNGGRIDVQFRVSPQTVECSVTDSGQGIPDDIKETLFEAFVTHNKTRGTGLGLAIVKDIVSAHGGTIAFESSRDCGTAFNFILPKRVEATSTTAHPQ